jgi:hypothetical protein
MTVDNVKARASDLHFSIVMRAVFCFVFGLAACGGARYRTELVGHGNGVVASRVGASVPSQIDGIQVAQGNYEVAMRFDVPRAQLVDWRVTCPNVSVEGQSGETIEQYRERRIAELQRERDQDAARTSVAASFVAGAIAKARVDVDVHAGQVIDLAPGDVGAGTVVATANVVTGGDGLCTLQVAADDPTVRAAFTITRIRDLDAEERMRTIARREVAVKARGQLSAQLVTAGAKPQAREAHVVVDVRARAEARALYARQEYLAYLAGKCDAKSRTESAQVRAREANLDADAARAQARDQAALQARATLQAQLVGLGAKARPAMPPPKPEEPGTAPFDGAEWVAGYWSWEVGGEVGGAWEWQDGGWHEPGMLWEAAGGVYNVSANDESHVRDHRRGRERDHRNDSSAGVLDAIVGGRHDSPRGGSADDRPVVRDHRSEGRSDWNPVSRDDDKKKDDDDKPIVRDHRH